MAPYGAVVGYGVRKTTPLGEPIPLTISRAPAKLHLFVTHTLQLDDAGAYLMNTRATYSLQLDDAETSVLTYDFVRNPPNKYPEAHLHIYGESDVLRAMFRATGFDDATRKPADLHIPVGGRRFRPCLEDIVEFCVLEGLVEAREGWASVLKQHRTLYHERQLKAMVRRFPWHAAEVLAREGWSVEAPADFEES